MIYDCFLFYKELDLLELRLGILDQYVDKFVLLESTKSFTGRPKPLYYQENQERFAKYSDKIIHLVIDEDPPDCQDAWQREKFQRNSITRGLDACQPDDVIILSDLDEIPSPALLSNLPDLSKPLRCRQLYFFYSLNNLNLDRPWWSGTRIIRHAHLQTYSLQDLRKLKKKFCKVIPNAGWHFSFMGDVDFIMSKLNDFSHQEFNLPEFNNPEQLNKAISEGRDILGRHYRFQSVRMDAHFPKFLIANLAKFERFITAFGRQEHLPSIDDLNLPKRRTLRSTLGRLLPGR